MELVRSRLQHLQSNKFTQQILTEHCSAERMLLMRLGNVQALEGLCSVGRGRQRRNKYVTHQAEMSTRRRNGTVRDKVQCQDGEGIIHAEGEGTPRLCVGDVTREVTRRLCAFILSTPGSHQCCDVISIDKCSKRFSDPWEGCSSGVVDGSAICSDSSVNSLCLCLPLHACTHIHVQTRACMHTFF